MLEHLHTTYKLEVNEKGHNRRTALHLAARYGRVGSSNQSIDEVREKHQLSWLILESNFADRSNLEDSKISYPCNIIANWVNHSFSMEKIL